MSTLAVLLVVPAMSHGAAPPADKVLNVVNRARQSIQELYVSSASNDDWGEERLGTTELAAGRSVALRLGRGRDCGFDIRVVFADSRVEERHDFDACRNRQVVFDGSTAELLGDHEVTVTNGAARPVRELYIVSGQTGGWGDDLLTDRSIAPTQSAQVSYRGGCHGDVRVVFDNDGAEERYGMDLCAHAALAIVPGWATAE